MANAFGGGKVYTFIRGDAPNTSTNLTPDPTGLGRGQEWHGGTYQSRLLAIDYRTGEAKGAPACVNLKTYPVKVENGRVMIRRG